MIRFLLSTCFLLMMINLGFCADESPEVKADDAITEEPKSSSLHDLMESIKDDFKLVYAAVKAKDATKKADILTSLANLKKNAEAAKKITPHRVEEIADADEQKKQKEAYQKEMDVMISSLDQLKVKVDADDWDGAMTLIKALSSHKKKSHEAFQDEEEEDH